MSVTRFACQLGTLLRTLDDRLLTVGNGPLARSSSWWVLGIRFPEPYFLPCCVPSITTGGYQLVRTLTDTNSMLTLDETAREGWIRPVLVVYHMPLPRLDFQSGQCDGYYNEFTRFNIFYSVSLIVQLMHHKTKK